MANSFIGLTDLIKLNDANARDLGVTDLLNAAPFLKVLNATIASNGTKHHYIKTTGAPTVGFRTVNTGKDNSNSSYTEVDINLSNIDASFLVDIAVAAAYTKGGPDAFIARQATEALQQAFFVFEKQIFYGTGNDSGGFAGLGDNSVFSALSGNGNTIINATGSTTNGGSSVWLIRTTPDERDMTAVIGNSGQISIGQSVMTLKADDTTATKSYGAWYTPIQAYCGLQIGSAYSAVRIANLTTQSSKGLTDALISQAMAKFPANRGPTHIVMNRQSQQQLQASRTATTSTGQPAPFPSDAFGVPIIVTDALSITEAIVA